MKTRIVRGLVVLPLLVAAGCATSAMKGTPFFTGEYQKRQGPVEERVNLWPLLYYRDPALSLLWPVGEYVKDEQFALRPLLSVYNLDDPDGREWNVLWPFIQHDQQSGRGRVFPLLWWGETYFNVFPLYWHAARTRHLHDILFPLWWYEREPDRRRLAVLLNLAGFERAGGRRSDWVFPFAGRFQPSDGSEYRYQLWPVSHQWENARAGTRSHAVLPLWWYTEGPGQQSFFSLLWSQGASARGERWSMLFPLFWSGTGPEERSFFTLLGGYRRSATSRSWLAPLLLSGGRRERDESSTTLLAGLGRWSREGTNTHRHVIPLFSETRDEEGLRFLSLPWSRAERPDGSGWTLGPLYYEKHFRDGHLRLSPFYASGSDRKAGESWRAVLPLYYSADHAGGHTFATLLGGYETRSDGTRWTLYPLLSRVGERGGTNDWWFLAPLTHFRWDDAESRSHVFPLYYRDTASDTLISPLYADWADSGGGRHVAVPPLLSWRNQGGGRDDWWLLAGLGRLSLGTEPGPSHVLPVYYQNPASGLTLSPVYCERRTQTGVSSFLPLLLSGYSRDRTGREIWSLAGLYGHEWRDNGRVSDRLLPLYAWAEEEYFYTLLAGWNKSGFRYYLTPLVSSWREDAETGFRVFPFYARSHNKEDGVTRTRFLWAFNRSDAKTRRSIFFPFYGYWNHGPLDPAHPPADYLTRGREFMCLPICWYDNTLHCYPSGTGSNRIHVTTRTQGHGVFPLWSVSHQSDSRSGRLDEHSLLWFLYDRRQETGEVKAHSYLRHRVLWRLYHYEKLNGNVSVDLLPGITYDARMDGYRKSSFLWRVFRWERSPEGKRKLDLLFVPLIRDALIISEAGKLHARVKMD